MDTQSGRFVPMPEAQPWMKRLAVGEIVTVKGEVCEVLRFTDRTVELKLLSAAERLGRQTDLDRERIARAEEKRRRRAEKLERKR
jgi:hypothetical protein